MDDQERLEALEDALDRLSELSEGRIILVEGLKDERALRAVGIGGRFIHIQSSGGPVKAAEHVWRERVEAVILTDWDRRGDSLASALRENLDSLGAGYDDSVRRDMSRCARPFSKDVESIDSVLALLRLRAAEQKDLNGGTIRGVMGAFIVVEGIDGTGKTTVCNDASSILRSEGHEVVLTMEPTHGPIGEFIRSGVAGGISQRAESLLFVADRIEHTREICRKVADGAVVISDRYYPSTLAYQSSELEGDSVDRVWLTELNEPFVGVPDAVILLDMDPCGSMYRVDERGEEESKFEDLPFQEQVRARYLELAERYGFEIVDASRPREEVLSEVIDIIREVL